MKIFIAIPAYDRKICCETARALINEQTIASSLGIELIIAFIPGCSLITHARNQAVRDFLKSDCDRLVFIDADLSWEPGSVFKLISHDVDFVGGGYRYKDEIENYPIAWPDTKELWADPETGLLEVNMVPTGFLALKRDVFKKLTEAHPDRAYKFHDEEFQAFFHCPPGDGEDGAFCRDWRTIGGKIWLEPRLELSHIEGAKKYTGNIGNWLKSRIK